jgi:hypothetical protein
LVRDMVNAGPYLKAIRQRLVRRGVELYLIADAVYWGRPRRSTGRLSRSISRP